MAFKLPSRILETTITTGTGTYTLAGAVTGHRTFSSELSNADTCFYFVSSGAYVAGVWVPGADYEFGYGTYTGGTLARTTILGSSNADAAVSWAAGSKLIGIAPLGPSDLGGGFSVPSPQGRLTLTTALPVTVADVTAAGTVYYTPYNGQGVPVWNGYQFISRDAAELSLALDSTLSHTNPHGANGNFDLFVFDDAGTIRLGTGPMWLKTSTVTMTIATPCVVTWNSHALIAGTPIVFTTTGALPTGLTAGTTYYVLAPAANTFNVAATPGGAAINTTGSQSGVHTAVAGNDTVRGTGAGTTELELKNGVLTNKNAITARFGSSSGNTVSVAANQATYVGSVRMTAAGQCEDSAVKRFLWNAYNRRPRQLKKFETTDTWTYTTAAYRQANAAVANQFAFLRGLDEDVIQALVIGLVGTALAAGVVMVTFGLDSTTAKAADATAIFSVLNPHLWGQPSGAYAGYPGLGYHYLAWLEYGAGASTTTWYGDNATATEQSGITGTCFA